MNFPATYNQEAKQEGENSKERLEDHSSRGMAFTFGANGMESL